MAKQGGRRKKGLAQIVTKNRNIHQTGEKVKTLGSKSEK